MSINWNERPTDTLIIVFTLAALLKVVGVCVALLTAQITTQTWAFEHWWVALVTGIFLLLLHIPLYRELPVPKQHKALIVALFFALVMHQIDLSHSSRISIAPLLQNELFVSRIGWTDSDANNIHALGNLFTLVPVVLASWQYGLRGGVVSLLLAATLYMGLPFTLPADSFNWWFYSVYGFVLLGVTLILSFVVVTLAETQRRKERELMIANEKLSRQAALMEQLATSRERNRLARELHDTLAHSLSGTAVQLQAVGLLMKVDMVEASAELQSAQQQIKTGLVEARRAITALRSSPLEDLGLAEALRQRVQTMGQRLAISVDCTIEDPVSPLSPLTELTFWRIADEALVNIEKHAQASQVHVSLQMSENKLHLTIRDNGSGFDLERVDSSTRFGLLGMRERADLSGEILTIKSVLGTGTEIALISGASMRQNERG